MWYNEIKMFKWTMSLNLSFSLHMNILLKNIDCYEPYNLRDSRLSTVRGVVKGILKDTNVNICM